MAFQLACPPAAIVSYPRNPILNFIWLGYVRLPVARTQTLKSFFGTLLARRQV